MNATKKEIVDTEALIERYRNEIEDLKRRLEEKEKDAPAKARRLSAREVGLAHDVFLVSLYCTDGRLLANGGEQCDEGPKQ